MPCPHFFAYSFETSLEIMFILIKPIFSKVFFICSADQAPPTHVFTMSGSETHSHGNARFNVMSEIAARPPFRRQR